MHVDKLTTAVRYPNAVKKFNSYHFPVGYVTDIRGCRMYSLCLSKFESKLYFGLIIVTTHIRFEYLKFNWHLKFNSDSHFPIYVMHACTTFGQAMIYFGKLPNRILLLNKYEKNWKKQYVLFHEENTRKRLL